MGTLIELLGCTDAAACNYDKDANTDDGSCLLVGDACDDSNEWTSDDSINDFCECIGEAIYEGCTDIYACNWASEASVDDGSCLYLDALGVLAVTALRTKTWMASVTTDYCVGELDVLGVYLPMCC